MSISAPNPNTGSNAAPNSESNATPNSGSNATPSPEADTAAGSPSGSNAASTPMPNNTPGLVPYAVPIPTSSSVAQTLAVVRAELGKGLLSLRYLPVLGLAALPILTSVALDLAAFWRAQQNDLPSLVSQFQLFADGFGSFILPICIFFGCTAIFMNLFRGELLDRCLHYYFLAPIRREKVLVGKYLAGFLTAATVFTLTTIVSFLLIYVPYGPAQAASHFQSSGGFGQLASYLLMTWLAILGYGAVFLVAGLFVKNPIIPGVILFGWESVNFLMPPVLKGLSVIHYLKSLAPIPVSDGPFALPAEPAPAPLAVGGVLLLVAATLLLASWRVRRLEVQYGLD